ncbi:MAG: carbohydrate ABC transporter permease [Anaerolineaceae bacterium]|jgi:multiple sugar transport system permease protein|nr:carbohydrate ABC transporter permease [Anaerolineaceae bacterium]
MHRRNYHALKIASKIIIYSLVVLAVFLSLAPIVYLFITSFKEPDLTFAIPPVWVFAPTTQNYNEVLSSTNFSKYFMNSVSIALITVAIAIFLGSLAAYGFSRFRFRGKFWLKMGALVPQMLPPIVLVVPLYVLFNRLDWIDTRQALIVSYLTFTIPLSIWMMTGFFDDVPIELEEAAMIDGCSRIGALIRVSLPLAVPGIAATAILAFIYCWNEFLYAVILTGREARTLPVIITSFMTNKSILWGRIAASGSLVLIPVIIFALLAQRYLVRGLGKGAVKG